MNLDVNGNDGIERLLPVGNSDAEDENESEFSTILSIATNICYCFSASITTYFSMLIIVIYWNKLNRIPSVLRRFYIEFLVIFIPVILSGTILATWLPLVTIPSLIISLLWQRKYFQEDKNEMFQRLILQRYYSEQIQDEEIFFNYLKLIQMNLLTLIRSTFQVGTAVCILAVDFPAFPRNFTKTRTYGVGVMDLGIGFFVMSMGLVWKELEKFNLANHLKEISLLIILGLGRTVTLNAINYETDETEYGLHWNAFLTLGFTKLFGNLILRIVYCLPNKRNINNVLYAAIAILIIHEFCLEYSLAEYVFDLSVPRNDNLLNANREGIFSLPGFISLYLFSKYIGGLISLNENNKTALMNGHMKLTKLLFPLWLNAISSIIVFNISRRICNAGYCSLVAAITVTILILYLKLINIYVVKNIKLFTTKNRKEIGDISILMSAVNKNGLLYFLVSNVLTGLVNILFKPYNRNISETLLILSMYSLINSFLMLLLYKKRWKIM